MHMQSKNLCYITTSCSVVLPMFTVSVNSTRVHALHTGTWHKNKNAEQEAMRLSEIIRPVPMNGFWYRGSYISGQICVLYRLIPEGPNVLPVTQPTVSKHCEKHWSLQPAAWPYPFVIHRHADTWRKCVVAAFAAPTQLFDTAVGQSFTGCHCTWDVGTAINNRLRRPSEG